MRLGEVFSCPHILGLAVSVLSSACATQAVAQSPSTPRYNSRGELLAPVGFDTWVFVGSNLGLAYKQGLEESTALERARADRPKFHNIYINPEAYAHFLRTGQFPEPTVLVMEEFSAADKEPKGVVASGMFNGERVGLEVAVKNSSRPDGSVKNCSRPDGSPTLWAYYRFTDQADPSKALASACAEPDSNCESCHWRHASRDNVWVQFYPNLRKVTE